MFKSVVFAFIVDLQASRLLKKHLILHFAVCAKAHTQKKCVNGLMGKLCLNDANVWATKFLLNSGVCPSLPSLLILFVSLSEAGSVLLYSKLGFESIDVRQSTSGLVRSWRHHVTRSASSHVSKHFWAGSRDESLQLPDFVISKLADSGRIKSIQVLAGKESV